MQHTPHIHLILWGTNFTNTNSGTTLRSALEALYAGLSETSYESIVRQYFDHTGVPAPYIPFDEYLDTRTAAPKNVGDEKIRNEVGGAIELANWPQPSINDQYIVVPAPGSTYESGFGTTEHEEFCGYHGFHVATGGTYTFVAWAGNEPFSECAWFDPNGNEVHATALTAAHEFAESVTDPKPHSSDTAWITNAGYEVADICGSTTLQLPNGTWGADLWDNSQNGCSISNPSPPLFYASANGAVSFKDGLATLSATVNPYGQATSAYLEWGSSASYGATSSVRSIEGTTPIQFNTDIGPLGPSATYHYRVVAKNSAGEVWSEDRTFTTPNWVPLVINEPPTGVGSQEATLRALIDPQGSATYYHFEYGPSKSLGYTFPVPDAYVGSGNAWSLVARTVSKLLPETNYFYRATAHNPEGTNALKYPEYQFFTTRPTPASYISSFGSAGSGLGQFNQPIGVAVDASGNVWTTDRENNRVEEFSSTGEFLRQFGTKGTGAGQFVEPKGIAVAADGSILVADAGNDRIEKFSGKGEYLGQFGGSGTGYGKFTEPYDVAVALDGTIWVSDAAGNKVEHFNATGEFTGWINGGGTAGSGNSQFATPTGLTVDSSGNVWVADRDNSRIAEFNSSREFIQHFGGSGSGPGQFAQPYDVVVKPSGFVLVVDRGNNRIQEFTPNGEYQIQFGTAGAGAGQMSEPRSIALGSAGTAYITDSSNARVERWGQAGPPEAETSPVTAVSANGATLQGRVNPSGSTTTSHFEYGTSANYGTNISIPGEPSGFDSLLLSKALAGLASDATYHFRMVAANKIATAAGQDWVFTTPASYISSFGFAGSGAGQFNQPIGVAVDASGNVWTTDRDNNRVEEFSATGEFLRQFGTKGTGAGQFVEPKGIAVTTSGNVLVVDAGNDRVEKFNSKGEYLGQFGGSGTGYGKFTEPYDVAVAPDGTSWVSDAAGNKVEHFNATGEFTGWINGGGTAGSGDTQFATPTGLTVDSSGNVWIADRDNSRVAEFNSSREFIQHFGSSGTGSGQFIQPYDVVIKPSGFVLVVDRGNNRIQEFTPNGEYQIQFGTAGSGAGQMSEPRSIVIDSSGDYFVTDTANARIERWG